MPVAGQVASGQTCEPYQTARPPALPVTTSGTVNDAESPFFWPACTSIGWTGSTPLKASTLPAMWVVASSSNA